MPEITKLTNEKVYRNSKICYAEAGEGLFHRGLIDFCKQHAGKKILDFGCATGNYCLELEKLGFECVGVDINDEYIKIARQRGIEAHVIKNRLPFNDKSFDTVIMFELLEHVQSLDEVLKEAKRVAKRNILITVPNCGGVDTLRSYGLIYDHFLELDHINFFTNKDLENILSKHFKKFKVEENEPINLNAVGLPWWLKKPLSLLYKFRIIKSTNYYRLYAIIEMNGKQ
jgi:SAM-dependent methyltransferase